MAATKCMFAIRPTFERYLLFLGVSQRCIMCQRHLSTTQIVLRKREKINPLEKFMQKSGKKFYYDVPQVPRKTGIEVPISKKAQHTESIRQRVVNHTLKKHITDLVQTAQVSQELEDAQVEITKVSVTPDYLTARVYWRAPGYDDDKPIEELLDKYRFDLRHTLIQLHVIGKVPPLVFIKDKEQAALDEVDRLLAVADLGPDEEEAAEKRDSDTESETKEDRLEVITIRDDVIDRLPLFNIDHHALNKQIMQNRAKAMKQKGTKEDLADILIHRRKKKKSGRVYEDPGKVLGDMKEETDSESDSNWESSGYESDDSDSSRRNKK